MAFDLFATTAYLQALHDLRYGALPVRQRERIWQEDEPIETEIQQEATGTTKIFTDASAHLDDIAGVFQRARPQAVQYQSLREQYARLRNEHTKWPQVPDGSTIRPGNVSSRVAALRQRLLPHDVPHKAGAERVYDHHLVEAVKAFQQSHLLNADGNVGRATLEALNVPFARRVDQIRANLERARWIAAQESMLNNHMVLVDIAGANVRYIRDGHSVWQSRVQVGRRERATPFVRSEINRITLNPTWTVPPTILKKDKLPLIREDPEYLSRQRMRVLTRQGEELDPATIDWEAPPAGIMLRQDAGAGNALGKVVLRFNNPFAIYLHDTPSKRLFGRDLRATSSGCVRVENVMDLVDMLMEDTGTMQRDELHRILDRGKTRNITLANTIPILIAYWTADIDPASGHIIYRPDIYGRDDALITALGKVGNRLPFASTTY